VKQSIDSMDRSREFRGISHLFVRSYRYYPDRIVTNTPWEFSTWG